MESQIILLAVIGVLAFILHLQQKSSSKHVDDLVKALVARNAQELVDLKRVEKKTVDTPYVDDEIQTAELDDEKWLAAITKGQ